MSGAAEVNDVPGYTFKVNRACDIAEPGVNKDSFDITINEPACDQVNFAACL